MMSTSLELLEEELRSLSREHALGTTFPPNCFTAMQAKFVEYESRRSLSVTFPVLEESLNPLRTMQGGFIVAAFDNVFGPLSYLAARIPCVTLNLNTQFIRPIECGDQLTVRVTVVSRNAQVLQMTGEAFNSRNKLIATSSATATVARTTPRTGL
ncbi:MAG: PaaI family thioesterase [Bacteroidota bacterium]|jgi:uncharacterized protein (TIGR00369 family)